MPINVCVKKQRTNSYLRSPPNSLLLQGGRALANHPLSCHPQRCIWKPIKGGKMENWRKTGPKACALKFYWLTPSSNSAWLGDFVANPFTKLQK